MKWTTRLVLATLFLLLLTHLNSASVQSTSAQAGDILITGRVTSEETGAPLADVAIYFLEPTFPLDPYQPAITDSSGYYTVTHRMHPDTWWILFMPSDEKYVAEYYQNIPLPANVSYAGNRPAEATVFTYSHGMVRSGIDAALALKGQSQIKGTVTAKAADTPLESVYVDVYDAADHLVVRAGPTGNSGAYTVTELAAGSYKLHFDARYAGPFYASEYYGGSISLAAAQAITVGKADVVDGVDISLAAGGVITGFLTSSAYSVDAGANIHVYDQIGQQVAPEPHYPEQIHTWGGSFVPYFVISNLLPGEYRLLFESDEHRPEYYDNQPALDQAQSVTVKAGEVTGDINAILNLTPTVTSIATSKALTGTIVVAKLYDPVPHFTIDGGHSWQTGATPPWMHDRDSTDEHVYDITGYNLDVALVPRSGLSGQRILANVNGVALYRSGDNGLTWAQVQPNHPCPITTSQSIPFGPLIVSPADPSRIYFVEACEAYYAEYPPSQGTYWLSKSTDGGVTWQSTFVLSERYGDRPPIVPSPVLADRLYTQFAATGWSWFESNDNGEHWEQRDFPVTVLTPDGQNANYLYGWATRDAVSVGMRSEDSGEHWVEWAQQPCYGGDLVASPTESKLLFVRCQEGIFRSQDGGDSWTQLPTTIGRFLVADYGHPGRLLLVKTGELWESVDKGDSWQLLTSGKRVSANQNHLPLYLPIITTPGP